MSQTAATVVLASAGTGKTYQLTKRLIAALERGVAPEAILALTFTRKAAGEILDRLLGRLALAASDEKERAELCAELGIDRDRAFFAALLARLARAIDRFQVTTLDAFFVRVARAFQAELGLPAEWEIADELGDQGLREQALGRLLEESAPAELLELLRDLQRADASRSVQDSALRAIRLGSDSFGESDEAAWAWIETPPPPEETALAAAIQAIRAFEPPRTKKGESDNNWEKNISKLRAALDAGDWLGLPAIGVVEKVLAGELQFNRHSIPDDFRRAIAVLLERTAHEAARDLDRQNRANWRLIRDFERRYAQVRAQARALRFEHLPALLCQEDYGGLTQASARLGARLDHLFLDEFQDTSPPQWRVLAPLARELAAGAAEERSVFCVGDAKQSIFGWRKAEPRLLENLPAELGTQPEDLRRSWRSSPIVIDTVNRVFRDLAASRAFEAEPWRRECAAQFSVKFQEHEAEKQHLAGDVRLWTSRQGTRQKETAELCLRLAAERAAQLHRQAPAARIAILLRRNAGIPLVLYELKQRGVLASGEGGNPLDDSAAVQVALSWLHLADHPGDSAALFHVSTSPLGAALGLDFERPGSALERARELRRDLAQHGYAEVLAGIEPEVARGWPSAWERRRFAQLIQLAAVYGREAGLRPSRFVARVRQEGVEDPSAARVRVMTVHRSKGLEFDAVILPELDRSWAQERLELYARRRGRNPTEPFERVSRSASKAVRKLVPGLQELYEDARRLHLTEALCLLYVALTRAVHHLELIVAPRSAAKDEKGLPMSPAALLRDTLDAESAEPGREIWRHERGSEDWMGQLPALEPRLATGETATRRDPIRVVSGCRPRELPREAASRLGEPLEVNTAELFAASSPAKRRGRLVHAWFERVEWLEGFDVSDEVLLEDAKALGISSGLAREVLTRFRARISEPEPGALLSREATAKRLGTKPEELELMRERPFAQLTGEDGAAEALLHGAFDRAVVARSRGRAELVDFKTDELEGAEAFSKRAEHYRPQLEAYRAALARITGLPKEAIGCRIAFVLAGRVVDL